MKEYLKTKNGILYNADCLDVLSNINDDSIDLVITSPPYDNLRTYNGYVFDFKKLAHELKRVLKSGGVIVWVVNDATIKGSETGTSFKQALYFKEIGLNLHDTMIFKKNSSPYFCKTRYYSFFEYMFILSKGVPRTVNLIADKLNRCFGEKITGTDRSKNGDLVPTSCVKNNKIKRVKKYGVRGNVWEYNVGKHHVTKDKSAYKHPAIFPEKLAYDHIISWSNENDLIFDPFIGSGTVAKMCEKLKRNWLGSEISKDYCEVIKERLIENKIKILNNKIKLRKRR